MQHVLVFLTSVWVIVAIARNGIMGHVFQVIKLVCLCIVGFALIYCLCIAPQATTKNVNTCNCPPKNFLGEICYLDGHHNITQSDSPKTTNGIVQTPSPFATARSVTATKPSASTSKGESGGSSVPIAAIAAGLAGAIVIILVVVVIIILYRRRLKQSESSRQASESRTS